MGLDDMLNKAKAKLKDENATDGLLDKAAGFAKDKFKGHEDKIDKVRDTLDDKIGSNEPGQTDSTQDSKPSSATEDKDVPTQRPSEPGSIPPRDAGDAPGQQGPGETPGEGLPGGPKAP